MILRRAGRGRIANCGRSGIASGGGTIRIGGKGVYRGKLKAKVSDGGLLVINPVGLQAYVKGVVPNEVPSSWPKAALRAQAVAARSYALATSGAGDFDVYDDTRSQVYGGKDSETERTNRAATHTSGQVVRHRRQVATTYFFSTSGGQTESVEHGFPGAEPAGYLKSVRGPLRRSVALPQVEGRASRRTRSSRGSSAHVLRPAAQDQGAEARGLPADRQGARGRLERELQGLRPRRSRRPWTCGAPGPAS